MIVGDGVKCARLLTPRFGRGRTTHIDKWKRQKKLPSVTSWQCKACNHRQRLEKLFKLCSYSLFEKIREQILGDFVAQGYWRPTKELAECLGLTYRQMSLSGSKEKKHTVYICYVIV